jgi:hypothetical protein
MSLNRLEDFASEGQPNGGAAEGPPGGGAASISVHDLIARGTPVSWDEAVAVVEEVCAVAVARWGSEAPVPALSDVLLDVTGSVTISRAGGEKSPAAAARALHAVLANADVPVPLRLFVTQAAAPGTHGSLQEFAAGLAYFGRPNRTELIQNVYKRAAALVRAGVEPTLSPATLPLPEKEAPKESPRKKSNRRRELLVAAACIVIACAAAAAWAWWMPASRGTNTEGKPVLSHVSAAFTDLANQIRERLTPAVSKEEEVPSAPASADPRPRPRRRATPAVVTEETPLASRQLSIVEPSAWQVPVAVPTMSIPVEAATPVTVAPVEEPASPDIERLFTKQDADVRPPMLQYPQLTPPVRAASSRPAPVNSVEVVVAPDGTVERARFVAGPVRMMDIMLVGSIKNWKFTPAFRDGEAVRYQTVISWSAVP